MTWGEIQLFSIQKMFLNTNNITVDDLPMMRNDKKYAIYLNAMPATANEGIRILLTRGKPEIKMYSIKKNEADKNLSTEDVYCFDLSDILDDFNNLHCVYCNLKEFGEYIIRFGKYLYLSKDILDVCDISVSYESFPSPITLSTGDNKKIDLPLELANLLPLYIASELYKDDDISLATVYRNEFETELENLRFPRTDESFVSINGWL